MPFNRPSRPDLKQRVTADIERHSDQKASSRGDIHYPLAQAVAGVAHGLHGHLQYNADQLFDDTADDANLLRRAAEMGVFRIAPSRAAGTVTGNDAAQIQSETLLQDDTQQVYRVTVMATIVAGVAIVQVKAVESGADSNQLVGVKLRFIQPLLDIDSEAIVVEISGGADIESIDRVAERLAERRKNPPMGGNDYDYITWAKAAHVDVTRAWCYSNTPTIGAVTVRFVTDDLASAIPTQAHIGAVTTYTDDKRPAGMKSFTIGALIGKPLDLTFTLLTPNTPATQAAIQTELVDLISREGEPGGILLLSQINEAISLATGERDHRIDLADDFTCLPGEFPILGAMAWGS